MLNSGHVHIHRFSPSGVVLDAVAREIIENWVRRYNQDRPHDSLGDLTPHEIGFLTEAGLHIDGLDVLWVSVRAGSAPDIKLLFILATTK